MADMGQASGRLTELERWWFITGMLVPYIAPKDGELTIASI